MERKSIPSKYEKQARERIRQIIDDYCDGSQQVLANKTGVAKASISQYVNGKNIPSNITAKKLCAPFGLNPAWIMGFDVPKMDSESGHNIEWLDQWLNETVKDDGVVDYTPDETRTLRRFQSSFDSTEEYRAAFNAFMKQMQLIKDTTNLYPIELKRFPMLGEIACGEPVFANEDRESYVMAGTDIKADFCLRAKGDSMINARIHDGDIVFIRKQDMVENGEIAAVVVNNDSEATLKRVYYYRESALLVLRPENPDYKDQVYQNEQLNEVHILGKAVAFQSDVK